MRIERLKLFDVKSPLPAPLHVAVQPGHGPTHKIDVDHLESFGERFDDGGA